MLYPTLWRKTATPSLWDDVFTARSELDRVFDRFLGQSLDGARAMTFWVPPVDVRETGDEIRVTAELPGLAAEDVKVTLENGGLTISGEKKQELEEGKANGDDHLIERRYGRFERRFTLPQTVDAEKVKAQLVNGVLSITLPKAEEAKPRRVQIEVAGKGR
jgi:HSP20 family protein